MFGMRQNHKKRDGFFYRRVCFWMRFVVNSASKMNGLTNAISAMRSIKGAENMTKIRGLPSNFLRW